MGLGQVSRAHAKEPDVIGIVTAMRIEARCVTPLRLPFNQMTCLGDRAAIWVCGMGEEAASRAAEGLAAAGATGLASFGIAGALDSSLRAGDLVLPDSVHTGCLLEADPGWRSRIQQRLPASVRIVGGVMTTSRQVLSSAVEKRALAEATDACAVDMETGAVARAATRYGIPFVALRAI
jgi:adenosylhomocysteine nucleosidase